MTEEQMEIINFELEHNLYYIEYPVNVTENWWEDGGGEKKRMSSMGLDHLKACIKTVEKSIKALETSDRNQNIINALMPFAQQKLRELKDVFQKKINS